MIYKAHLKRFWISEVLQFMHETYSICNKFDVENLQIADKVIALRAASLALDSSFKRDCTSEFSSEIVALDQRRDVCIIGIRMGADAYTYHFDFEKSSAAAAIINSIDKFGKVVTLMNYQSETSTIESIIESWATDSKLATAIQTLHLTDWVNELKTTNELFSKAYHSRMDQKLQNPKINTVELRQKAIDAYQILITNIEARSILARPNLYDELVNQINELVEKYNVLVDNRSMSNVLKID